MKTPKREKFINFLKSNSNSVDVYGSGLSKGSIYLKELVNKYRNSKIILNFNQAKTGFSIRVFPAIGAGPLLLAEYSLDISKFFKKGVHLDWFKSQKELLKLVRYYLENNDIRERIAKQGQEFVRENFSWEIIMKKIIKLFI